VALQLISLSGRRGQFHLFARVLRRRQKSPRHALAGFAHREFAASGHREYRTVPWSQALATSAHRRLTARSSGAPTAWGPGRAVPHFVIMHRAARAPRRRLPLSSNVRPQKRGSSGFRVGSLGRGWAGTGLTRAGGLRLDFAKAVGQPNRRKSIASNDLGDRWPSSLTVGAFLAHLQARARPPESPTQKSEEPEKAAPLALCIRSDTIAAC
jgi:hypothetical protein